MRERAARGIGLVFPYDAECLATLVVANDGHGRAELHPPRIGRRWNDARGRSPRSPVAQVARVACQRAAVVRRLGRRVLLLQARDLGLNVREPLRRDEVRMRRDRPLGQLIERVLAIAFFNESPAHDRAIGLFALRPPALLIASGATVYMGIAPAEREASRPRGCARNQSTRKKFIQIQYRSGFLPAAGHNPGRNGCTGPRSLPSR